MIVRTWRRACLLASILVVAAAATASDTPRNLSPDPLAYVAPSRPFATEHIALDLDVDVDGKTIAGSVSLRLRSLADPLEMLSLNAVGLTIESVTVDGTAAAFEHPVRGDRVTSWIESEASVSSEDRLVIRSPQEIPLGQTFTVVVRYHGAPAKGLYFIGPEKGLEHKRPEVWSQGQGEDNRYWIPCHDYPDEKSTFEGRFRVAKGYYALSNGVLAERRDIDDKTEFHWRLDQPQGTYLIMLAAGAYEIMESEADGVPLLLLTPPGTSAETASRAYGITGDVMQFLNREIGIDYPFGKYAQVVVQNFIWGGMENTSATVMNSRSLYDASTALTRDSHGLVAHELAHQWWGDMVTCREWSHLWLNEGFATYYTHLYRRHQHGEEWFQYEMHETHEKVVAADHKDARPLVVDFFNRTDAQNSANVYIKGASVLHMLRNQLGDARFREAIKRYGLDRRGKLAETSDLARTVREVSGSNLDWFFEQWAYLVGHPVIEVTKSWDPATSNLRLDIDQVQARTELTPVFRIPVEIELVFADGERRRHRVELDRAAHSFLFTAATRPTQVVFDPDGWILKELRFAKPARELIEQLRNGSFLARVRAAESLGNVAATSAVVAALRDTLLSDAFWGLRRETALALGNLASAGAVEALLEGAETGDARVRLAVAEALANVKPENAVVARLKRLIADDPAWEVRSTALTSLVAMRADGAAAACRKALAQDSFRSFIRVAALEHLRELGHVKALDDVAKLAQPGNDRWHRHSAIHTYAALAKKSLDDKKIAAAAALIGSMLDDWYLRTRRAAIDALAELGEPARPYLARASRNDPLDDLRGAARAALGKLEMKSVDEREGLANELSRLKQQVERLENELNEVRERQPIAHDAP